MRKDERHEKNALEYIIRQSDEQGKGREDDRSRIL